MVIENSPAGCRSEAGSISINADRAPTSTPPQLIRLLPLRPALLLQDYFITSTLTFDLPRGEEANPSPYAKCSRIRPSSPVAVHSTLPNSPANQLRPPLLCAGRSADDPVAPRSMGGIGICKARSDVRHRSTFGAFISARLMLLLMRRRTPPAREKFFSAGLFALKDKHFLGLTGATLLGKGAICCLKWGQQLLAQQTNTWWAETCNIRVNI